jgi:hypothetical protein
LGAGNPIHSTANIDRTGPFNLGNQSNYAQFNPQYLHQDLLGHPEYRQMFIDHVQKEYFNGGALTVANNVARLLDRKNQVDPAIIAESARWGDAQVGTPLNKSHWQAEINWLTNTYLPNRNSVVLNQLRTDGLFTTFSAPTFSQHGGDVPFGYGLTMTASAGTIYFTTDGVTDPRMIGGAVNPAATAYSGAVSVNGDLTVKARLRTSAGAWSGLVEATFNVATLPGDFDSDGDVDGRDFLRWQRGQSTPPQSSGDLVDWQNNYGTGPPLVAESVNAVTVSDAAQESLWLSLEYPDQYSSRVEPSSEDSEVVQSIEPISILAWDLALTDERDVFPSILKANDDTKSAGELEFDSVFAEWETARCDPSD